MISHLLALLFVVAQAATPVPVPPQTCPALYRRFAHGEPMKVVWLVTHQRPRLADQTIKMMAEDPRYAGMPILLLISETNANFNGVDPRANPDLAPRTAMAFSNNGEIKGVTVNAETVHLAGGNIEACLNISVDHVMKGFLKSPNKQLTFVVHQSLLYGNGRKLPIMDLLVDNHMVMSQHKKDDLAIEKKKIDDTTYHVSIQGHPDKQIIFKLEP